MASILSLALLVGVAIPLVIQERSLTGRWEVRAEAASGSTAGGGTWSRNAVSGVLTVTQQDGTLTGTWTDARPNPLAFEGRRTGDGFEIRTESRSVSVTIDGTPTTLRMRWTIKGTLEKDRLRGTMSFDREDAEASQPQPFTAERKS